MFDTMPTSSDLEVVCREIDDFVRALGVTCRSISLVRAPEVRGFVVHQATWDQLQEVGQGVRDLCTKKGFKPAFQKYSNDLWIAIAQEPLSAQEALRRSAP
jgi:hypothetical protein